MVVVLHYIMKHTAKKKGLALKGRIHRSDLTVLFEGMLRDFKNGSIRVGEGTGGITLALADDLDFEIRADIGKGRQKLLIELKWDSEAEQFHWQDSSFHATSKACSGPIRPGASTSDGGANALAITQESILTNEEKLYFSCEGNMFFTNASRARKDLLGKQVYNFADEKMGTVEDLILTPDQAVSSAVVGTDDVLGKLKRELVIPIEQLIVQDNRIVFAGAGSQAATIPGASEGKRPAPPTASGLTPARRQDQVAARGAPLGAGRNITV